jgi:hypothetical protein
VKIGDASRLVLELCDDEAAATADDDAGGAKSFEVPPPPLEEDEFGTVNGEPEREPGAEAGTMRMRIGGGRGPVVMEALGSAPASACSGPACAGEVDLGAGTGGEGENELCAAAVFVTAGAATGFSCALWMPVAVVGLMRAS